MFYQFLFFQSLLLNLILLPIAPLAHAEVIERIVAIVNSEIITLSDLNSFKEKLKSGGLVDDALMRIEDKNKIMKDPSALIQHLVYEKLLDSEIKKNNLSVTVERVEQEMRSIAKKNGIDRSQLKEALKQQGIVFSEYQNFIKKSLERQALISKEISSKIRISDEEISNYYVQNMGNKNKDLFEYNLSHILFRGKNAKERAHEVYQQLQSGESFESLAAKYSEDKDFTQGGFFGKFGENELNTDLLNVIKPLAPGETTGVIKIGSDYHILKLNKKVLIENPDLKAKKEEIQNILFNAAFVKQFKLWLERKKQEAFIRINTHDS